MKELLSSTLAGLGQGSVYALLALGFVIIYKSMRVISFAQPALMLAGAVLVSYLVGPFGFIIAVILGVVGIALLGLGLERTVIRPMVGKPVFVVAIITLGIDIALRVVINGFIGTDVRQVGDPWGFSRVSLLGVTVQERYIAMFLTTAVVITVLFAFFKYTRLGLATRAASYDQETALAQGISVSTVFAMAWAIAGGLAAIAGTFVATGVGVDQQLWIIALKALPAIILGGLDSLGGAVVGGLTIGVVESLIATYQSDFAPWLGDNFSVVSPYVVMLLVLLVKPYGLFGTKEVERV
ncbi:branched-chain amino acid ABC transporter permease [Haloechinothrix halophila]|uniref:branched-chain amino acid ABC transporter permease n=1 Tax=Haloechinothrix halophila TaxID=1069073 RepID=UPI0004013CF2|nr:branched-chain amino acid ABC transporter permease [Haloechinothrix halophila]